MRKSIIFSLLLFGCFFFVRPSAVSAFNVSTDDFPYTSFAYEPNYGGARQYSLESLLESCDFAFAFPVDNVFFLACYTGSTFNMNFDTTGTNVTVLAPYTFSVYRRAYDDARFIYVYDTSYRSYSVFRSDTLHILKYSDFVNIYIDGVAWSPLPPIELNRELTNNFTISRYRFAGYSSTNARYAISTDPAPSTDCDYYWSTTFMGPDLNQVTNMLNEFRHQDSEDLEQWLINHALDKSYRISNSVTYHYWTNEQMNTFDSRTGLFTIALPNSFIDAYDLSSVPAEDLADVQRIIYFSGYPVLVRMYFENRVTRERSPLTSVEYKPSALAFWDYAGVSDFLPDPDDIGFSYTPGELVYDADLSDVTGVLYDVNYFSGWLANIVNALPAKSLSFAFMTFIVTIIVGVVGVVLR